MSGTGDDSNVGTSRDEAFASLSKAIEQCNASTRTDVTVCVVGEVASSSCARITDGPNGNSKNITIIGVDDGKIVRQNNFQEAQDTARGTYNPALIEVTSPNYKNVTLTLENITLDDGFLREGSLFNQASSGDDKSGNTDCVQDAIVAGYGTDYNNPNVKVILGNGAVLQNFGGMSAVRVTGGASLEMQSGSRITDTTSHDRTKFNNIPDDGIEDDNGAAGAVWVQGTVATMGNGATIDSVTGRAFYIDNGGSVHAAGTISNIQADADMWQGTGGVIAHVRNGSKLELQQGCLVSGGNGQDRDNDKKIGPAFDVLQTDSQLIMKAGAKIEGWSRGNIIYAHDTNQQNASEDNQQASSNKPIIINGTICNNDTAGNHVVQISNGYIKIGEQALIKKKQSLLRDRICSGWQFRRDTWKDQRQLQHRPRRRRGHDKPWLQPSGHVRSR